MEDKPQVIERISTILGVPVTDVEVLPGRPGRVRFHCHGRKLDLRSEDILDEGTFLARMFELTSVCPRFPRVGIDEEWADVVDLIGKAMRLSECSKQQEVLVLLADFAEVQGPLNVPYGELLEDDAKPFIRESRLWFRRSALLAFARSCGLVMDRRGLMAGLLSLGAHRRTHALKGGAKNTSRSFWGVPADAARFHGCPQKCVALRGAHACGRWVHRGCLPMCQRAALLRRRLRSASSGSRWSDPPVSPSVHRRSCRPGKQRDEARRVRGCRHHQADTLRE